MDFESLTLVLHAHHLILTRKASRIIIPIRLPSSVTYTARFILLPLQISAHMGHFKKAYIKIKCFKIALRMF
jgi:hypothetical protein